MDGGVIASATWAGYVAAATTQRLHWRRPSGEWWWEWISLAHGDDVSTCDGDYDGGAVEGAPVALAFDAGHGSDGGLWIGHAFGLQVLDLTHGALQRFGVYDGPYRAARRQRDVASPSAPPSSGSARRAASRAARRRMASGGTSPGGDGCPARR